MTAPALFHNSSTYANHGCRCDDCRADWSLYQARLRAERAELLAAGLVNPVHGKYTTFVNYSCRCDPCRLAWNARIRGYRAAKR